MPRLRRLRAGLPRRRGDGERDREIGTVSRGQTREIPVISGLSEHRGGVRRCRDPRRAANRNGSGDAVIDCPPGSGCAVMEAVSDADYCLLVAEPTAFGFHNFKMVHRLVTLLDKPFGVIVNKADGAYPPLDAVLRASTARPYCCGYCTAQSSRKSARGAGSQFGKARTCAVIFHGIMGHHPGGGGVDEKAVDFKR